MAATVAAPVRTERESPVQVVDLQDMMQARRTEAMPKHSLFGSTLEKFDKDGVDKLDIKDIHSFNAARHKPRRTGRFQLPEPFKSQLRARGDKVLAPTKEDIEKRKEDMERTDKVIESIENSALQFELEKNKDFVPKTGRSAQSLSDEAQKVFKEMNRIGLNERSSYNHDKYGNKPPVHQYSMIGDILRPGMETFRRNKTEYGFPNRPSERRVVEAREQRRASAHTPCSPHSVIKLPPNIRHQFGSRVCDNLLSDKKLVEKTITDQKTLKEQLQRASQKLDVPVMERELKPEYEMLGNAMRQNVFPGYTMNHKLSMMKNSYTDSVHLRRYPDPDQWRYQRDELSTWAEHNVLQTRMKKAWEAYFLETLNKKQKA